MKPAVIREAKARGDRAGFSRADLLAVLAALAILGIALLPALARTHVQPQGTQCLSNLRQLTMGWMMYANDNRGKVTPDREYFPPDPDYNTPPPGVINRARWVGGDMRGGSVGYPYPSSWLDATNIAILSNPMFTALTPYVKNPAVYRCPADHSTWHGVPRVRSYSMNGAIGSAFNGTYQDPGHNPVGHWLPGFPSGGPWRVYLKEADMVAPAPSQLLLLVDEHPESINDAAFVFQMPANPLQTIWIDIPTPTHDNAGGLSFADGHVEMHRWLEPGIFPPVVWAVDTAPGIGGVIQSTPQDPDILWMAHRMTAPMPGTNPYYPGP